MLSDALALIIAFLRATLAQLAARITPIEYSHGAQTIVQGLSDLPEPVDGVIALAPGRRYLFTKAVVFNGIQLQVGASTVIEGTSSESAALVSTGLGSAPFLISAPGGGAFPFRNIRVTADGPALALDGEGDPSSALDWIAVNFVDCPTIGTIQGYTNFIMNDSAMLDSAGLTFDGEIGTVGFFQCIWTVPEGATAITLPATFTATRRFRWTYSPMVVPATSTGIAVADVAASFPEPESFFALYAPFSGAGTYVSGADYDDAEVVFLESVGLTNSSTAASYYMVGNATATAIAVSTTFYKVAGTTTPGEYLSRFTAGNPNELVYTGAIPRWIRLTATATVSGSSNKQVALRFAVEGATREQSENKLVTDSGGRVESLPIQDVVLLSPGDTVSVYLANNTDTSAVTVENLSVLATAIA